MWKVWIRELDATGKVLFEYTLTKEYKDKGNASKLAKKFAKVHPDCAIAVGQENPFEE